MVNVIIDKNLSQNDLNTLECWVKNKQMTLQRDKCKMLFGSLKKSMVIMGGKKNLLAVVLVEKRHLGFIWLKAQYKLLNLGRQLKSGINGTIMYWSWEVTPCSMVRPTWRLVFVYLLFSSVQFSFSVVSHSLRPHESQHARPPCPSPTPGVHPNSCIFYRWSKMSVCQRRGN